MLLRQVGSVIHNHTCHVKASTESVGIVHKRKGLTEGTSVGMVLLLKVKIAAAVIKSWN